MIEPLSFHDRFQIASITNFSRLVSYSILDENGEDVEINTTFTNPVELIIPRDSKSKHSQNVFTKCY